MSTAHTWTPGGFGFPESRKSGKPKAGKPKAGKPESRKPERLKAGKLESRKAGQPKAAKPKAGKSKAGTRAKAKSKGKAKAKAKAKAAADPPTSKKVGGWDVFTFTRGGSDKKAGNVWHKWVSSTGQSYYSLTKANEAGFEE